VPASPIAFALLSGICAALYTVGVKVGAPHVHAALGAMIITGVAFVVNLVALVLMRAGGHDIVLRPEAYWLLVLAGVGAAGVDVFSLLAYERGLRITSSFIIGGTSTALVLIVGFLVLQEPLTVVRVLAIALIATGILLLQTQGA